MCNAYIYLFSYSLKLSNNNLSQDFIDFLHSYFEGKIIEGDVDLNLRFYASILQSYIEYQKEPDEIIIKGWKAEIKPFLLKIYKFEQNGIFNINADIKFLINDIDKMTEQSEQKKINIDNKLKENINIIYEDKEEFEDDLDIIKINLEEKLNNEKKEIKDIKVDYKDDFDIDEIKRPFNFKAHSLTLSSKSTSVSINDEFNEKNEIQKMRYSFAGSVKTLSGREKEITPFFLEVFEAENINIVKKEKIISQMTFDLFLKKIVVGNFYDEYIDYIINFAEQCFYFMKRDIIFKKIIDCYRYYTEIKVPFEQRKNLLNFISLLVVKSYECYIKLEKNEEILIIIEKFYNDRINELKSIIEKNKKSEHTLQEIFVGGINYIKNTANKLVNSENKDKAKNEVKNENIDIEENLNLSINKKMQLVNDNKQNNLIFKEDNQNIDKEKMKEQKKEKNEQKKEKREIPEEQVLRECENIINLIKNIIPNPDILLLTKNSLNIFKLKKLIAAKKENIISKGTEKKLQKCNTERTFNIFNIVKDISNKQSIINKPIKNTYFSCLCYEVKDIGEQLLDISVKSLYKIKMKELYNGAFLKKTKLITSQNVMENINKSNRLTSFIIEDILSYDYPQDRARVLERWVEIAEYLKKRKDYNDILSINSALRNYIIRGLNLTWKELSKKTKKIIDELDVFCSFENNYKNFRDDIKSLNKNDFFVPYLGLLLKDLNFYEEKYKYIVDGNMINFEKINGVQKAIDDFFQFKNIKDKKIINLNEDLIFFEHLEDIKESYLEDLANKIEPKFTLYNNRRKIKRLTYIDKSFFRGKISRGSLTESIKINAIK